MDESNFHFRNAGLNDIQDIIHINNSYLSFNTKSGFLITKYSETSLAKLITNNPNCIFVATENGVIIGFIAISFKLDTDVINTLEWFDQSAKNKFEQSKPLYIEKVAVKIGQEKKQVGTFLYHSLIQQFPDFLFYSFIVKKPSVNLPSIKFHQKTGFIECAIFKAENFMGLDNYKSIMYIKL